MKRSVPVVELKAVPVEAPRTLAEVIYRRLRRDIIWGVLAPGAPLRSDELRDCYDVGVSPLREALSRLVTERLVTAVGQRGFRVAPLTSADVLDTINTRVVVEREALARSIATGGIEWETDLVAAYHSLSRIPIPHKAEPHADVWAQHHRRFHMALLAACGSSWLLELAGLLFDHAERHRVIRARTVPEPKLTRDIAAEHKEILAATLARKSKAAVQALERHYRATAEQVIAAFDQTVQKQKPK